MQTQIIPVKGKLFEKQAITARMTVGRTTVTFEQREDAVTVRMTDKGEYLGEIPFGELLQFFLSRKDTDPLSDPEYLKAIENMQPPI